MQIGIVGLGRMGANIARRLMRSGHDCVVFDANLAASLALGKEGAKSSDLAHSFAISVGKSCIRREKRSEVDAAPNIWRNLISEFVRNQLRQVFWQFG